MESLEGCSTNVYKLDNLTHIPYVVYTPSPECEPALRMLNLKSAEYKFRIQGKTVVADLESQEFWWFSVNLLAEKLEENGEPKEQTITASKEEEELLESCSLTGPSHRVLNVSNLATPVSSLVPPTPTPSVNTNPSTPAGTQFPTPNAGFHGLSTVTSPHEKSAGASQAGDETEQIAHRRFIEAVMALLSFTLARSKKWLPLNFRSFLSNPSESTETALMTPPATPAEPKYSKPNITPASITSFSVTLTTSGTLMIIPSTTQQKALRQLSTSIPQLTDVWLAPTGIIGRYIGSESDEDRIKWEKWKVLASKWMVELGLEVSDASWAKVQIYVPDEGLLEVVWPMQCIFYRATNHLTSRSAIPSSAKSAKAPSLDSVTLFKSSDDLGISWFDLEDSLTFAEEWITGKEKREAEAKTRRENKENAPVNKVLEEPKAPVYPTPPDVVPAPTPVAPTSVPTPAPATKTPAENGPPTAPATVEQAPSEMEIDDSWLANAGGENSGSRPEQGQDMFGDLRSMGMGPDDGLNDDLFGVEVTEADFDNFFDDEPNNMGPIMEHPEPPMPAEVGPTSMVESKSTQGQTFNSSLSNMDMGDFNSMSMEMFENDRLDMLDDNMDLDIETMTAEMDMHVKESVPEEKPVILEAPPEIVQTVVHKAIEHIQTPPLSPHRAMKLLLPGTNTPRQHMPSTPPTMHRLSLYSPVAFSSLVEKSDRKYQEGGRFFCPPEKVKNEANGDATAVPRRPRRSSRPSSRKTDEFPDISEDRDMEMDSLSEHSSEFSSSDADETSEDEFDVETGFEDDFGERGFHAINSGRSSEFVKGRKRKRMSSDEWATYVEGMHRDERMETPQRTLEGLSSTDVVTYERRQGLPPPPWALFQMDSSDYSLSGIFSTAECKMDSASNLGSRDMAMISKYVTDQIIWSSMDHLQLSFRKSKVNVVDSEAVQGVEDSREVERSLLKKEVLRLEDDVSDIVKNLFGALKCTLSNYLKITDLVVEMPLMGRRQAKPGAMLSPGSSPPIFKIEPPHVHVHRNLLSGDSPLEILPPALHFWDTFGLAPHSGAKNVVAFCVHPAGGSVSTSASMLLDRLGAAYEGCRLGKFSRGTLDYATDGLLSFSPKTSNVSDALAALEALFQNLGQKLTEIDEKLQNVVIFALNPFSHPSTLVEICNSFYKLQKVYFKSMQFQLKPMPNNIVLQVIPIDAVAVKDGILARGQGQLVRLALEVYERCTPSEIEYSKGFPLETYSPSIVLAQPPPKSIDFKLTPDPSPAILQENKCLHIAYSQSIDERWISVAWSDNWGEIKVVENFCLGRRDSAILKPFEDVCKDIWEKTMSIISAKKVHWRLILAKAGVMDKEEIDIWTRFSSESTTPQTITILSADVSPPLSLSAQLPAVLPQHFNPQSMMYSTPGNTPGASVSPDQFGGGSAGTPSNDVVPDLDADSTLLDYTDETWGVILSHRMPNTESLIDFRYALASGYLIKRGGPCDGDDPVLFSLSLLHQPPSTATAAQSASHMRVYENTLREVLGHYRGLLTLAQHLNVIDMARDVAPWHIAAAVKAQEALSLLL